MDKQIATVAQTEQTAPSTSSVSPDVVPYVTRDITWQQCEINAEDCRIKAEQQPSLRDIFLTQAAYWDRLKEKLV